MLRDVPQAVQDAEFLAVSEIARLQHERLEQQLSYVQTQSDFYAELWGRTTLPVSIDGLRRLPLTDKEMLRADQAEHPPFGRYLAASSDQIIRAHRTGGTTGQAMNLALSELDAVLTAEVGARSPRAAGLGPGDRVIHCLNYQLWMGGYTDHAILERTGATVVPFGVGSTERLVDTIRQLGITAISCTPSYPAVIERVIADCFPRLAPRDLGLKLGLFGGEAGLDNLPFRQRLEDIWGFKVRNANYGVTDVLCNFSSQCDHNNDLHFLAADVIYPELIRPEDGTRLAWKEGSSGELVLTHLAKQAQPLVRFRTGDIVTLTGTGPCACRRTATRFRVIGRVDDMVVVRGINVFPTMVAAVVGEFAELSGEYRIMLSGPGPYHTLPLEVELARDAVDLSLAERLAAEIKKALGVSASIEILPAYNLPRTAGKTKRVIRNMEE
ncbi:MAG: phenylacetate--CoA ligase family protein [Proteobacteria bacterium]|nr:phenylacetate--CoA ligase family protein [Pseudomonadota bacterium]